MAASDETNKKQSIVKATLAVSFASEHQNLTVGNRTIPIFVLPVYQHAESLEESAGH